MGEFILPEVNSGKIAGVAGWGSRLRGVQSPAGRFRAAIRRGLKEHLKNEAFQKQKNIFPCNAAAILSSYYIGDTQKLYIIGLMRQMRQYTFKKILKHLKYIFKRAVKYLLILLCAATVLFLIERAPLLSEYNLKIPDMQTCKISVIEFVMGRHHKNNEIIEESETQALYDFAKSLRLTEQMLTYELRLTGSGSFARYNYSIEYKNVEYQIGFGLQLYGQPYEEPAFGQSIFVFKTTGSGKMGLYNTADEALYTAALEIVMKYSESD